MSIDARVIELSELRIGNILLYKGEIVCVTMISLDIDDEYEEQICFVRFGTSSYELGGWNRSLVNDLQRIPLTPEWLERMGCEVKTYDDEDGALVSMHGLFTMQPFYQKGHSLSISHAPKARKLRYVHEFQNYYQILTGEELTIK